MTKIIHKGKGDTSNQDSYRGIALENSAFKIFSKILTKQITTMVDKYIPECQFGFRKGRSTIQAVNYLIDSIEDTKEINTTQYS